MRQSSQGLLTVINDILDLSRMEAGEFRLSQDVFEIRSVLDEVGGMMGYLAGSKGLEWEVQKVGEMPSALRGDPVRLRQVLLNLAGNAVKFTERGLVSLEVRPPGGRTEGSILEFRVEDSGPGIPPGPDGRDLPALPPARRLALPSPRRDRPGSGHRPQPGAADGRKPGRGEFSHRLGLRIPPVLPGSRPPSPAGGSVLGAPRVRWSGAFSSRRTTA
jgi:hypothetical protein